MGLAVLPLFGLRWLSPEVCRLCARANGKLQEDLGRGASPKTAAPVPHPCSGPLPTHASAETLRLS